MITRTRITALAALALGLLALTAATPAISSDTWRHLYLDQLSGYREERAARIEAEALAYSHEKEAARLAGQVEALNASVEPLRAENERLREYEHAAQLLDQVQSMRQARHRLSSQVDDLQSTVAELQSDKFKAQSDLNELAGILEQYGTGHVWLNTLASSASMEPTFGAADIGLMMPADAPLLVGDIAYFVYPYDDFWFPADPNNCTWREPSPNVVAHRVIERTHMNGQWHYRTQGDANPIPDGCMVPQSAVQWVTPEDAVIQEWHR